MVHIVKDDTNKKTVSELNKQYEYTSGLPIRFGIGEQPGWASQSGPITSKKFVKVVLGQGKPVTFGKNEKQIFPDDGFIVDSLEARMIHSSVISHDGFPLLDKDFVPSSWYEESRDSVFTDEESEDEVLYANVPLIKMENGSFCIDCLRLRAYFPKESLPNGEGQCWTESEGVKKEYIPENHQIFKSDFKGYDELKIALKSEELGAVYTEDDNNYELNWGYGINFKDIEMGGTYTGHGWDPTYCRVDYDNARGQYFLSCYPTIYIHSDKFTEASLPHVSHICTIKMKFGSKKKFIHCMIDGKLYKYITLCTWYNSGSTTSIRKQVYYDGSHSFTQGTGPDKSETVLVESNGLIKNTSDNSVTNVKPWPYSPYKEQYPIM